MRRTYLPLSGEVAVASGDAKEEGIELWELLGGDDRVVGLRGRVQLFENVRREGLANPRIALDTG